MSETIFAVSSGGPPAAIAVLRVSGPVAGMVVVTLAGALPTPRRATLRRLRDRRGEMLDHALVLWFPGPDTATGEDLLELHLHGGRAVVAAVERAVAEVEGTRRAEPGEFTRRALLSGRIDLTQAAGLADLLEAETESQRRAALTMSEGAFGRDLRRWLVRLSDMRASIEAAIDYDEEGDVAFDSAAFRDDLVSLSRELDQHLSMPTSERVREGWRIVIAGPPNAGKSSLFNALLERDVAIVAPIAGTTRDRIEARVQREGQIYTLIDTAGLAEWTDDPVEQEGIRRSREMIDTADLVLWMDDSSPPATLRRALWLKGRCDEAGRGNRGACDLAVSSRRPKTIERLWTLLRHALADALPATEAYLLQEEQHSVLAAASRALNLAAQAVDPLIVADHLRHAAAHLSRLLGVDHIEAMLDALFSRFCVGK